MNYKIFQFTLFHKVVNMETSEREKELINQIIVKKSDNKYKWSYLLIELIIDKIELNMSYADIAEWLSNQGLSISENTLKNIIWRYKKKSKKLEGLNKTKNVEITKPRIIPKEQEQKKIKEEINYSEKLRLIEQEQKDKNSGFDQFDGL